MGPPQKQLAVLRHAKSSWADAGMADHDRPLNARGRRAAALVGRHLRAEGMRPELVLCSSATRTRQTLDLLDVGDGSEVLVEDQLYGAGAGELMARLRQVPDEVGSVLLIGHNPGVEDLTWLLGGDIGPSGAKFPTGALAVLDLPVERWMSLERAIATLRSFVVPRDLE